MIFLGAGNMAKALAKGLLRENPHLSLRFFSPSGVSAKECAERFKQHQLQALVELRSDDIVILACKPQQFSTLALALRSLSFPPKRYVSLMAGISQLRLMSELPQVQGLEVIRLMPALQIGFASAPSVLFPSQLPDWAMVLEKLGPLVKLTDEEMFHLATCLVGSLPGVIAELLSWNVELGVSGGLNEAEVVRSLAASLRSLGEAFSHLEPSSSALINFRDQVTSKAGITEAIIKTLGEESVAQSWKKAMRAGEKRSREL